MGGGACGIQFPTLDAEFKFAEIQNSPVLGGGGLVETNFPTFDAEFKFAKIRKFPCPVRGGSWKPISNI